MARHPGWATRLFSHEDLDTIAATVHAAERGTSGEIRVHLERRIPRRRGEPAGDALARATHVFHRLRMHTTDERNAVLIYVAVERRRYNEAVKDYNTRLVVFPDRVVASFTGFKPKAYFEAVPEAATAPKVKF